MIPAAQTGPGLWRKGPLRIRGRSFLIVLFVLRLLFLVAPLFFLIRPFFLPARWLDRGDFFIIQLAVLVHIEALEISIRSCGEVLADGGFLVGINHTIVVGVVFGVK